MIDPKNIPDAFLRKNSRIIDNNTVINATKITDSYKVDTGGRCIIIILFIIAYRCIKQPPKRKLQLKL